MRSLCLLFLLLLLVLSAACGGPDQNGPEKEPFDPGNASFRYRPSVEQIHVWMAEPGALLEVERDGVLVAEGIADEMGSFVFRKLAPGKGYIVRCRDEYTSPLQVMSVVSSMPPPDFYTRQKLESGFGYLTMRDGTQLSVYVTLPGPIEEGPYPTVVNYSGYSPSRPGRPLGDFDLLCDDLPVLCDAPEPPCSLFAGLMGYATVNVNKRGTGCSGGAYDYFETLQVLDGYDIIEIVAAQEWVLHNHVGMVGLSYPGITQLFVGRSQPPGLAAVAPLSVIGSTHTTLVPGGILND
ncbi:MAG: CocE/NonD family hydrolase, partial [Myxococcota bacterium]